MENLASLARFGLHLASLPVSSHVTAGLCKIGGLECLSHSTGILSALSILKNGAQPSVALQHAQKQKEAKFFVLRDSKEVKWWEKWYYSRYYSVDRGALLGDQLASRCTQNQRVRRVVRNAFAFLHCVCPPTVYFVYTKQEIERGDPFQGDQIAKVRKENGAMDSDMKTYWERIGRKSLETTKDIPNSRIGLVGVAGQLSCSRVFQAVYDDPIRVITGVAQVALGSYLTCSGLGFIT